MKHSAKHMARERSDRLIALDGIFSVVPNGSDRVARVVADARMRGRKLAPDPVLHVMKDGGIIQSLDGASRDHGSLGRIAVADVADIFRMRFGETPSATETRLLSNLLTGMTLKEISEAENVSYETRRNQLRVLLQKSQLGRQQDLVTIMSVLIMNRVFSQSAEQPDFPSTLRAHIESYYPLARIHVPILENGHALRIVDIGPLDGRAVFFFHSTIFPLYPLPGDLDVLDRLGLRMIIPLRPGFFADQPAPDQDEWFPAAVAEFARVFNFRDVLLLAHAAGAASAIATAKALGDLASALHLNAPQYFGAYDDGDENEFRKGWAKLINEYPDLVRSMVDQGLDASKTPEGFIEIQKNAYSANAPDIDMMTALAGEPWYLSQISFLWENAAATTQDMLDLAGDWPWHLAEVPCPVHVTVGREDVFGSYGFLKTLNMGPNVRLELLDGHGQDSRLADPDHVFSTLLRLSGK
jgi:pimeloyl-ACP methyl ester carboxylesterase